MKLKTARRREEREQDKSTRGKNRDLNWKTGVSQSVLNKSKC